MRKYLLIFSTVLLFESSFAQTKIGTPGISITPTGENYKSHRTIVPDDILYKIAKDYFRSNPFDKTFSEFLNHLFNDPTIINKTIHKRTDSTFFYFRGEYTTHHPFFFPAKRMEVIVAESEEKLIDSLPDLDTVITYQLAGYTSGDADGRKDVTDEFEKFDRKYKKKFVERSTNEIKAGNVINGSINSYYIVYAGLAPLSVAWQKIGSTKEHVYVITFRFEVKNNLAVLAVPAYSP